MTKARCEQSPPRQELFRRINDLLLAIRESICTYTMGKVIRFLKYYIISRFGMKEEQMKNLHSPETERHAAGHAYFIREYALLKKEVLKFEGGRKKGCRIPLKSGMRQAVNSDKTVPNKG